MDKDAGGTTGAISWVWVFVGVVVGTALLATLVPIVRNVPPRPDVAILVGALTFALMGVLVSYNSPGDTALEAGLAGVILSFLTFVGIRFIEGFEPTMLRTALGFVGGITLAGLGGWGGEVLQGTYRTESVEGLQWPWIGVGALLGVMLSVYAVFLPTALWGVGPWGVLGFFASSFFVAAFFVGYFSPGVTIIEPAIAAVLIMVIDAALASLGFRAPFPLPVVVIGMMGAFVIALGGGYLGEVIHNIRFGTSWGNEDSVFHKAPKPE